MIPGPFRNLALIGFMGAGKTSAGEALAARLGWSFLDADREIEREAGRTIAAIFEEDGEPAFRSLEERVVGRLSEGVECGARARGSGRSCRRSPAGGSATGASPSSSTSRRRRRGGASRPMRATARSRSRRSGFAELYEQRRPLYHATCDALVDAEDLQGEEALLAPLARPAALAELPRLVGARRAALIADRAVLRVLGLADRPARDRPPSGG